jgi:hypothetical protein
MQNNTESITKQFENAVELTNLTEAQLEIVKQILLDKFN